MKIKEIEKEFLSIINDGKINGFTFAHYSNLKDLEKRLSLNVASDKESYDMNLKIKDIIDKLYKAGVLNLLGDESMKYIIQNSSLLPLILANNDYEITIYGDNSYRFLCQFHKENHPSLCVTDHKNLMTCFGCKANGNALDYLKQYEDLTFKQAIQLVSQIYLYDIKTYNPRFEPIVKKYQESIISDTYKELLEKGRKRMERRGFESKEFIEQYYHKKYEMIKRVSKGEYDPNFEYSEPVKRVFLSLD